MAEFAASRNNALPYPVYGLPYVVTFPLLDADGDPVSPSAPDSEISKNGDTFADCTNEAVEIATSSGICYLSLTGTELTTDIATVRVQSTGAKTTVLALYPRKLVSIRAGTSASGGVSTSTIVLDASASAVDDFYNGMIVAAVIDGTTEVRMITDYTGSTQTATVTPDWNTAPDNNDAFTVYLPEGVQIQQSNVTQFGGSNGTFSSGRPEVNTTHAAGTAWGSGAITATSIATGALTAAKFAAGAIDAAALAADAGTEIATAVWASGTRTLTSLSGLTVDTVTTLTNLPTIPANWLTAAGTASDFGTEIGAAVLSALGTGTWASAIPWNASWDAEVQSEVADALAVYDPPTNAEMEARTIASANYATASALSTATTHLTDIKGATWSGTTDSLEAIRDRGDAAWTTATGFSTHSAADVWSVGTRVLTAGTNIALAKGTGVTGFTDLSAGDVRTAVGLASANLDTQLGTLATQASVNTIDDFLDTEIAAIKAKTDNLPSDPADQSAVEAAITSATSGLATQTSVNDLPTNAELATALASADDATLAAIAALSIPTANQNADALLGRNVAGGSSTGRTVSQALFMLRNKVSISGGTMTVYSTDDVTTSWSATLTSDANADPITAMDPG